VKELKGDINKLNVNGGAMALGHPLGATGVKLMTTLVHELERRSGRYGILAICEGGGTANATIIERTNADGSPAVAGPAAGAPRSRL
jgi:acetyl-CoA acetyltransferase